MEKAEAFQTSSSNLDRSLLITTKTSPIKDSVTQLLVKYYTSDSLFIKVIDISSRSEIDRTDYTAIVKIYTWETWEPPSELKSFMERTTGIRENIIVLTTPGAELLKCKKWIPLQGNPEKKIGCNLQINLQEV